MKNVYLLGFLLFVFVVAGCSSQMTPVPPEPQGLDTTLVGHATESSPSMDCRDSSNVLSSFSVTPETLFLGYDESSSNYISQGTLSFSLEDDFVYKYGYYALNDGSWQKITLDGTTIGNTNWLQGSGSGKITIHVNDLPEGGTDLNKIALYSCSKNGNGGSSFDCHLSTWQEKCFTIKVRENPQQDAQKECQQHQGCWSEELEECFNDTAYNGEEDKICANGQWQVPEDYCREVENGCWHPMNHQCVAFGTYDESLKALCEQNGQWTQLPDEPESLGSNTTYINDSDINDSGSDVGSDLDLGSGTDGDSGSDGSKYDYDNDDRP